MWAHPCRRHPRWRSEDNFGESVIFFFCYDFGESSLGCQVCSASVSTRSAISHVTSVLSALALAQAGRELLGSSHPLTSAPRCCDYRCTSPPRSHTPLKRISPSLMKGSFWYPLLICRDQEAEPSAELEQEQMNSVLPPKSMSFKIVQLWEAWTSGPSWCLPKSLSLGVPMASRLRAILESGSGWEWPGIGAAGSKNLADPGQ